MEQYFAVAGGWNCTSAEWWSAVLRVLFSCLLDLIDPLHKIKLLGFTAARGESYAVEMTEVALWKPCSEMMPVHYFTSECHSRLPSSQDAWECWEPAAPAGAHLQELWDSDSDIDRAACHGSAAPCLLACSTRCTWLTLTWRQKLSKQPPFATLLYPGGKPPCTMDAQHF